MYTIKSGIGGSQDLGANLLPDRSGASFRVWAPNAGAVEVRVAPAEDQPPLVVSLEADPGSPGYWTIDVEGVAAGHLYQFQITNRGGDEYDPGGLPIPRADPCARQVTSSDPSKPA